MKKTSMESRPVLLLLAVILVGAFLLYVAMLTPERFGSYYDDSVYVTTAKALATGEGYRIISLPYEPAQTKYPPLYPFLLSLIWRMFPSFPENLVPMMMLSVVATVCFLALTWRYLLVEGYAGRWKALIVVALAAVNVWTILFAASVLSEMTYAAMSVGGLYLAERYEKEKRKWIAGAVLGLVIGLSFLTRSSGLALLAAVGAYYVMRREWRRAIVPVGVGAVFVLGWSVWCHFNRTTYEGANVAYYTNYLRDFNEIIGELQAEGGQSRLIVLLNIAARNLLALIFISLPIVCLGLSSNTLSAFGGPLVALGLILVSFLLIAAGFIRRSRKGLRLLHIYIPAYIALHLVAPYSSYDRYLVPLLPFLLLFLVSELEYMLSSARRRLTIPGRVARKLSAVSTSLILFFMTGLALYNYGSNMKLAFDSSRKAEISSLAYIKSIEWIKANTDSSDTLICSRDPFYYLHTNHKAARALQTKMLDSLAFRSHQPAVDVEIEAFLRIVNENNARYFIVTQDELEDSPEIFRNVIDGLLEKYPGFFTPVFESADGQSKIYRIENYAK